MNPYELQLRQDFLSAADICITRYHYRPSRFLEMLDIHGPVITAISLVMDPKFHEGFTRLWELKRLDLSVEAIIRRPLYNRLFSQEVLDRAKEKLDELDYHE